MRAGMRVLRSGAFRRGAAALLGGGFGVGLSYGVRADSAASTKEAAMKPPATTLYEKDPNAGKRRSDLPDYKLSDVAGHKTKSSRIWVTFHDGVYDITDFVEAHPGGDRILLAAGASIEPFWQIYQAHRESDITLKLLESMRIGNLDKKDRAKQLLEQAADPYGGEPSRHPALEVLSARPFNAECPSDMLVSSYYTPQDLFYVRNHMPVPALKEEEYRLTVRGKGIKTRTFTLEELKQGFKHATIAATLQCAGNRRLEMSSVRHTDGLQWGDGAISNAQWTGVRLSDVLAACGYTEGLAAEHNIRNVQLEGYDEGIDKQAYGVSISTQRATTEREDVILAWGMNGEELSRDHGYPLRIVCPGIVAARSVKWLRNITLATEESQTVWMQKDYKNIGPNYRDRLAAAEAVAQAHPVREMPVQSAICEPESGEEVDKDATTLDFAGYAWSGGGRGIQRVDVSIDNGMSWTQATLAETEQHHGEDEQNTKYGHTHAEYRSRQWSWTLWRASVPIAAEENEWRACVKAVNTANDTQPETPRGIWNLRGLLNNSWMCVDLRRERD
eukprot:TRINITY_DN319_c4_g1_i1.p1 TRINITY_DN319_c4_g1~~TRINITY_DN319_c4_g1_i1.p1  ORF type:complete len:559 (+),score=134.35 TRINITY_DN319_c4_g1_i1:93-1769(+)